MSAQPPGRRSIDEEAEPGEQSPVIGVRVSAAVRDGLKAVARARGVPMSEIVREALAARVAAECLDEEEV